MSAVIGVGIIGCGDISGYHMNGVREAAGAKLIGCWNRTRSRAETKAQEFSCEVFDTVEALIADARIQVVYVLTNVETHKEYAIAALRAGKHVLVEKPVAWSVEEMREIKRVAAETKLHVVPVHNEIYDEESRRAKQLIESGRLGTIVSLHIMYCIKHADSIRKNYPGVIRQTSTHAIYRTLYLVGQPVIVSAMSNTVGDATLAPQEDIAMITMKTAAGTLVHVTTSFAADDNSNDNFTYLVKVIGTKGQTSWSFRSYVENEPGMAHSHTYSSYPMTIGNCGKYFLEQVLGKNAVPPSTINDAILVQKVEDAAYESVKTGKHVAVEPEH